MLITSLAAECEICGEKIGCQRCKNCHLTPIKFSKFIFPTKPLLLRSAKNIDSRSSILANNCEKMVFFESNFCFMRLFWAFGMLDLSLPWNFLSYRAKSTSFFVFKTSKNRFLSFFCHCWKMNDFFSFLTIDWHSPSNFPSNQVERTDQKVQKTRKMWFLRCIVAIAQAFKIFLHFWCLIRVYHAIYHHWGWRKLAKTGYSCLK